MFPGAIDPRMMRQAMKRLGVQQTELEGVREVVIRLADKEIVIAPVQVSKVTAMGNESWQVEGRATERALETRPTISEEDVQTVMEQAGVDKNTATKELEKHQGDLAAAILGLGKQ
jgi:nascent polypeptide-associated complex subunit alpha